MKRGINILHISDLHIGNTCSKWPVSDIAKELARTLTEQYDREIDTIIFTGDIFDGTVRGKTEDGKKDPAEESYLNEAVAFFDILQKRINEQQKEHQLKKDDFLFVPGNHDVCRTGKPWRLYDKFFKRFYGKANIPNFYKQANHMLIKADLEKKVLYIGFNSNMLVSEGSIAKIDIDQFMNADDEITVKYKGYDIIVFLHHPCCMFPEINGDVAERVLSNLEDFNEYLVKWNVKLVLYGHKHYDRAKIVGVREGYKVCMIAANTIARDKQQYLSCNLVQIDDVGEVFLKSIDADNKQNFDIQDEEIRDGFTRNLVTNLMCAYRFGNFTNEFRNILKSLDAFYCHYVQLEHLKENRNLLLFSIKVRLYFRLHVQTDKFIRELIKREEKSFYENCVARLEGELKSELNDIEKVLLQNKPFLENRDMRDILECDKCKKIRFSYVLVAAFLTDIYIEFTNLWEERTEDGKKSVEFSQKGGIKYDEDCKFIYVTLKCYNEIAHESAVKKINEFQSRFYKLREYFYCVGIKADHIYLRIRNDNVSVKCRDWEAHIPRLTTLLTGTNIYESDYVFARELIQNAIDAISFREKFKPKEGNFNNFIKIEMGYGAEEKAFFCITDHGIGMKEEVIEQYFSTLGRSYYKEYDIEADENQQYNAISNFGIGFLSVFRVCKEVVVETKHFEERKYNRLVMEGGKDSFLVYTEEKDDFEIGTRITCYFEDKYKPDFSKLCKYIQEIMVDIKYEVRIEICGEKDIRIIEPREVRKQAFSKIKRHVMFIPFNEDTKTIGEVVNRDEISTGKFIGKYRHGILLQLGSKMNAKGAVLILNAGILMKNAKPQDIFDYDMHSFPEELDSEIVMNFPPNWLQIDVSRDKVIGINKEIVKPDFFKQELYSSFRKQLKNYIAVEKGATLYSISSAVKFMRCFCNESQDSTDTISLCTAFTEDAITFRLDGECKNAEFKIERKYEHKGEGKRTHNYLSTIFYESLTPEEFSKLSESNCDLTVEIKALLERMGLSGWKDSDREYLPIVLAACLVENGSNLCVENKNSKEISEQIESDVMAVVAKIVENMILKRCTLADLEKECIFSVKYDRKQLSFDMESDDLGDIIINVLDDYHVDSYDGDINDFKYNFIWNMIIWKQYDKYYNGGDRSEIRKLGQEEYGRLNRTFKVRYSLNPEGSKINLYQIASCYMMGLLRISNEKLGQVKGGGIDNKNKWVLDCGMGILTMWKRSEYKKADNEKYELLCELGSLQWPERNDMNKQEAYLRLLALKDIHQEEVNILTFSELLSWIVIYNETCILRKDSFE